MPAVPAIIGAVGAIGGAAISANASKKAGEASAAGSEAAIAEQQRQFDTIMQLQRPYSVTGTGAMNQLAKLYGLPYSPYSDAATMGGGQGYSGSGIPSSSSGQSTANKLFNVKSGSFSPISNTNMLSWGVNPLAPIQGIASGGTGFLKKSLDPLGLFGSDKPKIYQQKDGTIRVEGKSGSYAGGYIDPATGQAHVYTPGTQNLDAALSEQVTNYLRTGEGSLDPVLGRFSDAAGKMRSGGYSYQAPADTDPNAVNGIVTPSGPDMSGFFASPDYNFRRTEGQRGIEQSAAARGGAFSGNALKALNQYNSNLASGEYGDYFNRLAAMAGIGQTATNNQSAAAMNTGNNIGNALMGAADSRASGIAAAGNAWGNAFSNIGSLAGSMWGRGAFGPTSTQNNALGYGSGTNGLWS